MDWVHLAQFKDECRAVVNAVINLSVSIRWSEIHCLAEKLIACQEGLLHGVGSREY